MAFISKFSVGSQGRQRPQDEGIEGEIVPLTFEDGKFIQINTSGSAGRQETGKQSQNIRLDRDAFEQFVEIGRKHFGGQ